MRSLKSIARYKTTQAIKKGILVKPNLCSDCKISNYVEAHHPDYSKPLKVMWLCKKCHHKWHKKHGYQKGFGTLVTVNLNEEQTIFFKNLCNKEGRSMPRQFSWIIKCLMKEQNK